MNDRLEKLNEELRLERDKTFFVEYSANINRIGNISQTVSLVLVALFLIIDMNFHDHQLDPNYAFVGFENMLYIMTIASFGALTVLNAALRFRSVWIRYVCLVIFAIDYFCWAPYMTHPLVMTIPIVSSIFYLNRKYSFSFFAISVLGILMLCIRAVNTVEEFVLALKSNFLDLYVMLMAGFFVLVLIDVVRWLFIKYRMAENEWRGKERELSLASTIQQGFLSDSFPCSDKFEISAVMIPSREVGGDFYDFFQVGHESMALVIADVSDKGIPAALFAATSKEILQDFISSGVNFKRAVEKANKKIKENNKTRQFITAFICLIDTTTGKLIYINAGHNPPCILHADGTSEFITSDPDFVLGIRKNSTYSAHELSLVPGDRLFLYTDGFPEKTDLSGELFGRDRLAKVLEANSDRSARDMIEALVSSVDAFGKGVRYADDMTALLFDFKAYTEPKIPETAVIPEGKDQVLRAQTFIREVLSKDNIPDNIVSPLIIASDEMLSNIDKYAYGADQEKYVKVSVLILEKSIEISFTDRGEYFNPLDMISQSSLPTEKKKIRVGGLGILVVWNLMDDMRYTRKDGENILTIIKNR